MAGLIYLEGESTWGSMKAMAKIGAKADVLAAALASGQSWREAAATAGVGESTVWRYSKDPDFRESVDDYRRKAIDQGMLMLSKSLADVTANLILIATSGEAEANQVKACIAVIDKLLSVASHTELEERLRAVEEQLNASNVRAGAQGPGEVQGDNGNDESTGPETVPQ